MGIILAILVFGLIVTIHELGHFLLAKKNGIHVEEFSIGMGPRLYSKVSGDTRYSIKLFPIGGSCMMGEDDAEDMSEGSFNTKPVWARISVIAAGPIFNFILAFIFAVILVAWVGYDKPVISGVSPGLSAEAEGMQAGDEILEMNGKNINVWREVLYFNVFHPGETVDLTYERDGKKHEVTLTPEKDENGAYKLGLMSPGKNEKANLFTALQYGAYRSEILDLYDIGKFEDAYYRTGGGRSAIRSCRYYRNMVGDTYEQSKSYGLSVVIIELMNIAILLSANLGVMNLVPFPALDGGRLVFLFIEAIRGKRVPPDKEGMVHFAGILLLFALMIFVMFNDIKRLF